MTNWYRWIVCMVALLGLFVAGCGPNMEAIERTSGQVFDKVLGPATQKAIAELDTRGAQLSGQISGINPGYVVEGYGIFGTGIVYRATIRLVGVSANMAGGAQGDQEVTGADVPVVLPLEGTGDPPPG